MDKTAADPVIGRLLDGRYRVGPRIARGGMATVYEALDERLERVCAVKVMHAGMGDDDDFAARFVREARSAARLSHPNVVSVFDQGDDDGTVFLVMEYVPGHTLRDLIRKESPMRPAKALELLDPVLSALAAAHASGMIHRDVKPENVLLAPDGRVKVADFGLARAVNAETQHTATGGVLIGTVSYLSPELVVDGKADARSDVYAVGVLLYELLTGRKPHEGDNPIQVAYKHVHEDVPPPSALVPEIPAYVDALVARATVRDRDHRPSDARALQYLVRRVRSALDSGVVEDPELYADLMPRTHPRGNDTTEIDQDLADATPTSVIGALPIPAPPAVPVHRTRPAPASRQEPTDAPPPQRPAEAPGGNRPYRPSRRGPVLLVGVLLLALLAGGLGWYYGIGRYTTTPGVIDLSVAQAREKVEAAGLEFAVAEEEFSETVTAGAVIRTDPSAGDRILEDGTVSAVVSLGPERFEVPVLRGETVDDASAALEEANLNVGRITEVFNETVPDGIVLRSTPKAGTELRRDNAVALVVSKGRRPIGIGDYVGRPADAVEGRLTERGLEVAREQAFSEEIAAGRIISHDPGEGETLFKGDTITLVVSQGPPLVEVPNVVGSGIEGATRELEAAGFRVRIEESDVYIGLNRVLSQSPGRGTDLPKGSTVTIFLV